VAVEVAVPEQPATPLAQLTEAFAVDTADGPEVAAAWPGRVTSGPEEAWESVAAWQPPSVTWQVPRPEEVFAWPLLRAASAPVAVLLTVAEQFAEPAAQFAEPAASDTLSNPPLTTGVGTAAAPDPVEPGAVEPAVPVGLAAVVVLRLAAWRVGWVNRVADTEVVWQSVAVAVQSDDPVDVFAAAGAATPVLGSTITSPAPVEEVFDVPLPEQAVAPVRQVTVTDAPLEPVLCPPLVLALNRPAESTSRPVVGWVAAEPEAAWQSPVEIVHEACPVAARVTGVVDGAGAGAGAGAGVPVPDAGVPVPVVVVAGVTAGMVSVWELLSPVLLVAVPLHPVAPVAQWASANACGPPSPAPFNA
jgi:hypothetical protein